jgi:queuine tRNA-ribosyltransferase
MSLKFSVEAQADTARAGVMTLPHGVVQTPVFMPVGTAATVKAVPQQMLEELGTGILLGNTYHLYLRPGHEMVRRLGGLHRFMSWDRCILTDSGGFQVFSLSSLRKLTEEGVQFRSHLDGSSHFLSSETSMEIQIALGADIIMAFDECTEYPAERERARQSMELTLRWAKRSKDYFEAHKHENPWESCQLSVAGCQSEPQAEFSMPAEPAGQEPGATTAHNSQLATRNSACNSTQALFGIVQGGMYTDLRRECAERLVEMDFPGYAIGGLSVGEPRELTYEMVARTLEYLPKDKPRYVMGVGTPEEIEQYARLGVDMMDCVMPTRAARHGLLFTSEGRLNIKGARYAEDQGPVDPQCGCAVCSRYTRAYLRHLYASNEVLAQVLNSVHNLAYYLDTMRRVRHSIAFGESTSVTISAPQASRGR